MAAEEAVAVGATGGRRSGARGGVSRGDILSEAFDSGERGACPSARGEPRRAEWDQSGEGEAEAEEEEEELSSETPDSARAAAAACCSRRPRSPSRGGVRIPLRPCCMGAFALGLGRRSLWLL